MLQWFPAPQTRKEPEHKIYNNHLNHNQDLRSTAIYGAKNYHFQDIATIHSVVA